MLELEVRAQAARNLLVLDEYSPLAPFCRGTLGHQREITDVDSNGGSAPRWYKKMTFAVANVETDVFQIEVFDKNDLHRGMLGACLFPLKAWKVGLMFDRWYPLYHGTMYAGELHIVVQILSRLDPPSRSLASWATLASSTEARDDQVVAASAPTLAPSAKPRFVAQPGYPAFTAPTFEVLVSGTPSPRPEKKTSPPSSPKAGPWRHLAQPTYPGYPGALTPTLLTPSFRHPGQPGYPGFPLQL
ncbi:hypothetical protein ACHHYP_09867 [Achlya hypogyna]|uniref:C2 domain-containing protein n=1 Tax=Achlya hypogyna TaxID=1202772 RepID=A0A1V9ZIP7_ACHHY|nr:hypothetical protein ACHHYP_09867 [Achlya hypogyna]